MVSYTTYGFYTDTYSKGRQAVIDAASFPHYALKATQFIKRYTFDNIDENKPFIEELQMCCCEVAEQIFLNNKSDDETLASARGIASEKTADYSIAYESSETRKKSEECKIKSIIYDWLLDTGYLYKGV